MLYAYRITSGQEAIVADLLSEKIKKTSAPVKSLVVSPRLKGYMMIECDNETDAKRVSSGVPHVKGMLKNTMQVSDIKELLESKPQEINFNKGDMVEVIAGPFKGEKAKIVRVDKEKEDVTIELVEVAVPIPVTTKLNTVKLLQQ
jgi:transcriptional antiterminator NusG